MPSSLLLIGGESWSHPAVPRDGGGSWLFHWLPDGPAPAGLIGAGVFQLPGSFLPAGFTSVPLRVPIAPPSPSRLGSPPPQPEFTPGPAAHSSFGLVGAVTE